MLVVAVVFSTAAAEQSANALDQLEKAGIDQLDALSSETGFSARGIAESLLSGKARFALADLRRWARQSIRMAKGELTSLLLGLCAPVLTCLAVKVVLGDGCGMSAGAGLLCRVACARVMLQCFASTQEAVSSLLKKASDAVDAIAPVLASVLGLAGNGSNVLSPLSALYAAVVEKMLIGAGVSLCGAASALAVVGNLSQDFRLRRMFELLKSGVTWLLRFSMAAFAGMLAVEGVAISARDTLAGRSAKMAMENMVPIIGRDLSGAVDAIARSARVVRGAAGITASAVLLGACAAPLIRLAAMTITMKLAAAIVEPASDRATAAMMSQFADAAEMLLTIGLSGILLGLMTLGGALASGIIAGTGA